MDKPKIRVLLIEDNPVDVILLREALDQDVLNTFKLTSVEKLKAAMQALKKSTFDVILVDLGLPDSQGLETFHKIHHQVPDVPKIILSGLPDEAVALEAVHAGAQDYLVKGMAGTSFAARAIRYAIERQKLSKVIYENEIRFKKLIEQSSDAFVLIGVDGKLIYESPTVLHITGYSPSERVGHNSFENIIPEDQAKVKAIFAEVLSQPGKVQRAEYRSLRKDGSLWWTESTATNLLNEPGVNGILVNFRDVTERKLAEEQLLESQTRSQGTLTAIPDLMFRLNREGVFLDYKADAKDLHTPDSESIIGKRNRDVTPPEFASLIDEKINTTLTTGKLQTFEYELAVPGRDVQTFEARMTPSGANEVTAIVRNITERKQADERLRLNELQMHALISSLDDIVFEVDDKGTYCNVWTANEDLLFQPREKVIGRRFDEIFGEEMSRPFFETLRNVLASGKSETIEYSVNLGDKLGWFAAQYNPIHTQNGPGNTVSILVRDITQRKEAEESLRESEERFRTLYHTMVQGVVYQDAQGHIISANPSAEAILGLTLDQMQGRASIDPLWKAIHEDGSDFAGETHPAMIALQTGKPVTGVVMGVFNPQHNTHRWINVNAIPQFKATETKPYQVYTTFEDITERKVSEMALQASEANYRNLVESSDSAIAVLDRAGTIIYANAEGIRIWKDPNIVGKTVFDIYDPAYAERYMRVIQSVLDTQTEIVDEEAETVIGGQVMWFRLSLNPLKNRDGSVTSLLLNAWDITERRQAEAALRTSEERYRFITDYVDDIVWQLNPQLQFVYVSPAAQRVLGYSVIESLQMHVTDMLDSAGIQEMETVIRNRLAGNAHDNTPTEYKMKHKAGHWVDVEVLSAPVTDLNGKLLGFVGITRDITIRKQTQIALAVSEQRLKSMIDSAMDAIVSTDEHLNIVLFNEAAEKMFGITAQDALGQPINRFIPGRFQDRHKDHMLRFSKDTLTRINSGQVFSVNGTRADGQEFPAESSFSYVETKNEKLFTSILRDVTERKQAETALQEAEQRYRTLVEQSPVVVYEDIVNGAWQYLSPQLYKILGYTPDEFVAQPGLWRSLIHPEDLALVEERTRSGIEQSQKIVIEYRIKKQDGTYAWVHDEGDVFHDARTGNTLIRGVFYDITERKHAEEALRESNETAQAILNAATESVFLMELDGRVIAANETTATRLGKRVSDLIGRNVLELLPPHVAESRKKQMEFVVSERKPIVFDDERFGTWIENSIYPIFDQDGSIRRFAIYGRDITERKRTEALVYAQRDLARAMSKVTSNPEALKLCLDTALQVSGMDSGGIYLLNAEGSVLELLHQQGLGESFVRQVSSYTADTENVTMLRSGATFQFGSEELERDELYQAEGIQAVIITPIFYQEQVIGCLNIASHTLTAVPQPARNALETIAVEIGNFVTYLRSESALRASEEKFRLITGTIDEVFWMSDPEMDKMLYISSAYEKVWGYTQKSLYDNPTSFLESVVPEERERVLSVLELQKLGLPFSHEYHIRDAWGTIRTIWDRGYPVTDETGKVSRFVGVAQDITERKQAENALVASEQRLRSLVNSQTHFVLRTNLEGKFTYWNDKYTAEFGWVHKTDDMHQASPMEGVCEYHHERAAETVMNCLLNPGQVFRVELDKPAKDGGVRTTLWEFIGLTDEHGQPSEVQCMGIEITELKQTERALKSRTKDLTLLLEAGRAFSEAIDHQQIYDLIYHYIKDVLPCDMLVVSSFDPQSELLTCEYLHTGKGAQDVSGFPPIPLEPPGQGTQSLVIRSGQSMLLVDYEAALKTATNKYIFDEHAQIVDELPEEDPERVRSAIIIPLRVEGQVAGAMQVFSSELGAHTEDHLRFVEALAFHISAALSNAKLFSELETRVQQRTAEVRDLYDKAPTGYHSLDASGRFIMINQTELNWLGYTREEMLGRHTSEFITAESQVVFQAKFVEFKQSGEMRDVEINFIRKDGTILPGLVNATAIYDEHGEYALSRSTVFDITARKKAEEALRESEERYRKAISAADAVPYNLDYQTNTYTFIGEGIEKISGYTYQEMTPQQFDAIIEHTSMHGDLGWLSTHEATHKVRAGAPETLHAVWRSDFRIQCKDGTKRWISDISVQVMDANNTPVGSIGILQDITERKLAEQAMRESEETYRALFENANDAIFLIDSDGKYVRVNSRCEELLGYSTAELINHYANDFIIPSQLPEATSQLKRLLAGEDIPIYERGFRRRDGSEIQAEINLSLIRDENGNPKLIQSVVRNITERKQAEQALRESEEQNRLLFEEAPESVVLFNSAGQIVRMNHTFELLTGYRKEKLIGHTLAEVGLLSAEQVAKLSNAVLQSQVSVATAEFKLLSADGMLHDIGVSVFALLLQGDQHFLTTMHDITAEKQAEETLRLANIEMERALRMKDEFLASMSHELRTPLTGILGLSEALQYNTYGELNEKQLKALTTIENSGHHLLDLINDILDISKIEAGRLELNMETCSLGDICQASLQLVKGMAHKKKQNVAFSMNPASISLRADGRRLKQVLVNLLSNAVKYSPENSPLGLEVNADDQTVYIAVWDNGIGISDTDLNKLFQPFTQLDSSLSRQQSGTGLGLALVQKLIDLHGGSIQVESIPGQGSRFTVVLPCLSPDATQPYQNEPPLPSQLALIIEDNEVDAERLSRYLKMLSIDTRVHPKGTGVIEKVIKLNPNLIMLDIQLPDSSGWTLLEQLKANEATRHIPIIITSVEEEREKAAQLGAASYLVKLFTFADLKVALARAREITIPIQTGERNMPSMEATLGTVMIVDDNEVNILMIEDFLRSKKFNVLSANSGLEFLARVGEVQPDIVLMDIQMPDMDGLETMRRLRTLPNSKLAAVPIVAITALAMPGDRERCIAAGANEYLSKPVRLLEMSELIKKMVERGKNQ